MSRIAHLAIVLALVGSTASADTLYSLPWQLRPVTNDDSVRIDSSAAVFNDDNGNLDVSSSTAVGGSYQLTEHWGAMLRLGFVGNNAPGAALDGTSFGNPLAGARYTRRIADYRLALFGGTTIPAGTGGGNAPDARAATTNTASLTANPADDALFEVNYMTEIAGVDAAYVKRGFTAQAEVTLQQAIRVRGSESDADRFRTNSAVGLHLGYFIGTHVSIGTDVRYQHWLTHPTTFDAMSGARIPLPDAKMDMLTVAVGARLHIHVGKQGWIHPGISYTRGLDGRASAIPVLTSRTNAILIDVPVTF